MKFIRYNAIVHEKVQSSEHPADVVWRARRLRIAICEGLVVPLRSQIPLFSNHPDYFKCFGDSERKNNVFMMFGGAYRRSGIGLMCISGRRGAVWITRWTWDFLQAFRDFVRRAFRSCLMEKSVRLKTGTRCFIGKMGDFLNENMSMRAHPRLISSGYHWHEGAGSVKIWRKS